MRALALSVLALGVHAQLDSVEYGMDSIERVFNESCTDTNQAQRCTGECNDEFNKCFSICSSDDTKCKQLCNRDLTTCIDRMLDRALRVFEKNVLMFRMPMS